MRAGSGAASGFSGRGSDSATAAGFIDSQQRSATAISDRCALLDPMFMVTSGSFREGRVVDGISGVKG